MKKKFKQILSALLVAVMLIGIAPMGGIDFTPKAKAMDLSSYKVGDIIEFGSYPQSEVKDSDLISKIEAAGASISWIDYNYYAGTGNFADGNMKPVKDMMLYKDITYNGNKYRAVKINKYRPSYIWDESSEEANYNFYLGFWDYTQPENNYWTNNVYYFKYEKLKWKILDPEKGLLFCEKIIDAQAYNNTQFFNNDDVYLDESIQRYDIEKAFYKDSKFTIYSNDYYNSDIRNWLNNTFLKVAFDNSEKGSINKFEKSYIDKNNKRIVTNDLINLPDCNDLTNLLYGFSSSVDDFDLNRTGKPSDYALCQGIQLADESYIAQCQGSSFYWLFNNENEWARLTDCVQYGGSISTTDSAYLLGVRPIISIKQKFSNTSFQENSYIADIWLSRNREKTPESKLIDSIFDLDSLSTVIYDDLKNNKDFQDSVNMWTGMKVIFDPEKGIEDIYLSEEDLYETLIFDLVKKIMYGKNEDTGNVIIDAANTASSTVGKVTKYKGYIDKIATITTEPEKNLLEILKDWKFNPKSDSYSKFYGMLNDADQASSKWTDNKFIEGIGTIADISSDVAEFYKRLACYIMLEDMSEETVNLLETLKEQTSNEKFKNALEKVIVAYNNYNIVSIICTMKLTQDTALDIGGAAFDDLAKCSRVYSTLRAGYKVGVALCDITMNTSKTIDAYKTCGATKEFINANKAAINVLKNKYLTSRNDFDAGVYVNAIRAYQYAFEIDMENGVEFVKKANDEGLVNKARKLTVHAFNFFLNKDNKTSYESMAESQKSILNTMEMNFSTLNNTWKFNSDYLRSDYPDIFPVYVKKEISQSKYAPNITSAYIDKSGKTLLTWNRPLIFKDKDGNVQTLWGSLTFDGIYATETVGGSKNTYDNANINEAPSTIEFYNASKFKTFNKDYTLAAYTDTTDGKVYSAAKKISVGNPLLKAEIRVASASEAGSAQVMFSIIDDTSSRYDSLKYTIYRKSDGGSWTKIDDIARETARFNGKLTLYKDTTAKKGQKYSYKVVSHMTFDNGMTLNSPESSVVSVIGGVGMKKLDINVRDRLPQIRTRSTNEEKKGIELSWTRTANVDGYEIYRIASYGTVYQLIKTVGKDAASYVDYDVDACTTYNYIVCPYYNNEEKVYDLAALEQGTADYKVAKIYSVDVSDITMNYKKSTTITPSITADDGAKYTVTYSSSNAKVATVDQNGKVYAAKKGSATITCTVTDSNGNTVQDTCKVTVKYSFGQWLIKILLFGWIWY